MEFEQSKASFALANDEEKQKSKDNMPFNKPLVN